MNRDHDIEQRLASIRDILPRGWWAIYQGSLAVGFSDREAFALLQTYILAQNPSGIRPDSHPGGMPPADTET